MAQDQMPRAPKGRSLDILLCTFGTRGDTQPQIRVVQALQSQGHRVRITVSPSLEPLVSGDCGLETYPIGRDMGVFIEFSNLKMRKKMVKMVNGEFKKLKGWQTDMLCRQWDASIDGGEQVAGGRPFVADAIIASLPGMLHVSVAQRLSVPLILIQANPRSPTRNWPHSTGNPRSSILEPCDENYTTWVKEEEKVWKRYYKGIINHIRQMHLGLEPLSSNFWPHDLWKLDIPVPCLVSPTVLPKPDDFPENAPMVGYAFPELAKDFHPEPALVEFLSSDKPTVYVDFSSNVHPDKEALTTTMLAGVKAAGVRAVVRKAWYKSGAPPPDVYVTGDLPHSWLFPRVSLVVHPCGAGTTAMSLRSGTPSAPIPMRGDQYLWAKRLTHLKAAPEGIYMQDLTVENLTALIKEALHPKYRDAAAEMSKAIAAEPDGAETLVRWWHNYMLETNGYPAPCSVLPDRNAVWSVQGRADVRLSALAAHVLNGEKVIPYGELDLIKVVDWDKHASLKPNKMPRDPVTDVVRQRRMEQGAWDFGKAEETANGEVKANGAAEGTQVEQNGEPSDTGRGSLIQQIIGRWGEILAAEPNGRAS